MAIGFPASYETELDLLGDRQAARDAIVYAFDLLGWRYISDDPDHFRATISANPSSWGEIILVSLAAGKIIVRSSCRYQLFDWGKNRRNVGQFLAHFSQKELRENMAAPETPPFFDKNGNSPTRRIFKDDEAADQ